MLGFLVAIAAGYLTPYLDDTVARPLAKAVSGVVPIGPEELRLVSFMIAMIAAGVLANLLNSGATFWVILGGVIGYFLTRIVSGARTAMDQRKG